MCTKQILKIQGVRQKLCFLSTATHPLPKYRGEKFSKLSTQVEYTVTSIGWLIWPISELARERWQNNENSWEKIPEHPVCLKDRDAFPKQPNL